MTCYSDGYSSPLPFHFKIWGEICNMYICLANVNTNIGQRFLSLINRCFHKDHSLRKIFNKNKVKISYSCMPNIKQTIDNQNKQKLRLFNNSATENEESKPCNCRKKDECPFDGNCLQAAVIYKAKVTRTDNNTHETYVGLTENEFKTRYRNHTEI